MHSTKPAPQQRCGTPAATTACRCPAIPGSAAGCAPAQVIGAQAGPRGAPSPSQSLLAVFLKEMAATCRMAGSTESSSATRSRLTIWPLACLCCRQVQARAPLSGCADSWAPPAACHQGVVAPAIEALKCLVSIQHDVHLRQHVLSGLAGHRIGAHTCRQHVAQLLDVHAAVRPCCTPCCTQQNEGC